MLRSETEKINFMGKHEKWVFKVFLVLKRSYSVNMNVRVESVNAEGFRPRC